MDECEGGSRHPPRSTRDPRYGLGYRTVHPSPSSSRVPITLDGHRDPIACSPKLSVVVFASDSNSGRSRERLKSSENLELDDFAGIGAKIKCYCTQIDISRYTYTPVVV